MKKLNIYFTAGIPQLEDNADIIRLIQNSGADMIEIGIPYSNPVADGPIIQKVHELSLQNGMTLEKLLTQLKAIKDEVSIPIILMGYVNPILNFGFEKFCTACTESGVFGFIIPDLPPIEFEKNYQSVLKQYNLNFIFLVTPETPDERILYMDSMSSGFLYAISSSTTTGNKNPISKNESYLTRVASLPLKNPVMIGFGIKTKEDFENITEKVDGGIIGTTFVNILLQDKDWKKNAINFIHSIKE